MTQAAGQDGGAARERRGAPASDDTLLRAPGVVWRTSIDRIIFSPAEGEVTEIVGLGALRLWELVAEPARWSEIVAALARDFDAEAATVERDLAPVVADLVDRGGLSVVAAS